MKETPHGWQKKRNHRIGRVLITSLLSVVNLTDVMDIIDRVMSTLGLLLGGLIGMFISWGVLETLNRLYPDYHFAITPAVGTISLGFSFMVGVIFGIYPANKAANLKPINALRYE